MELTILEPRPEMQDVIEKYDHPLMPILRACAEGKTVINARDTIVRAGLKDGLPRLALSFDRVCHYRHWKFDGGHCEWGRVEWFRLGLGSYIRECASIPTKAWGDQYESLRGFRPEETVKSECPPIPKWVLEMKQPNDVFCWEVEEWQPGPNLADPVLLRPIFGEYCEVVAQWDLTPLEKEMFEQVL